MRPTRARRINRLKWIREVVQRRHRLAVGGRLRASIPFGGGDESADGNERNEQRGRVSIELGHGTPSLGANF
jgi:hypothetical protein